MFSKETKKARDTRPKHVPNIMLSKRDFPYLFQVSQLPSTTHHAWCVLATAYSYIFAFPSVLKSNLLSFQCKIEQSSLDQIPLYKPSLLCYL